MKRDNIFEEVKKSYKYLGLDDESKYQFFTVDELLKIGEKLAEARITSKRGPRQHYKDIIACTGIFVPQTKAQYKFISTPKGHTEWIQLQSDVNKVLEICPELSGWIAPTKSGKFSKMAISFFKDFVILPYSDMQMYLDYRERFYK